MFCSFISFASLFFSSHEERRRTLVVSAATASRLAAAIARLLLVVEGRCAGRLGRPNRKTLGPLSRLRARFRRSRVRALRLFFQSVFRGLALLTLSLSFFSSTNLSLFLCVLDFAQAVVVRAAVDSTGRELCPRPVAVQLPR